jgi:hypothetical protein
MRSSQNIIETEIMIVSRNALKREMVVVQSLLILARPANPITSQQLPLLPDLYNDGGQSKSREQCCSTMDVAGFPNLVVLTNSNDILARPLKQELFRHHLPK